MLADPERRRKHDIELIRPGEGSEVVDPRQLFRVYLQRGVKAYKEKHYLEAANNFDLATQTDPRTARPGITSPRRAASSAAGSPGASTPSTAPASSSR